MDFAKVWFLLHDFQRKGDKEIESQRLGFEKSVVTFADLCENVDFRKLTCVKQRRLGILIVFFTTTF